MEFDHHYCDCPGDHTAGHCRVGAGCSCFCYICSKCDKPIKAKQWPAHQRVDNCVVEEVLPPPDFGPDDLVDLNVSDNDIDSLLQGLDNAGASVRTKEFLGEMRECLEVLVDRLSGAARGKRPLKRTSAWQAVASILLTGEREPDDRIRELLEAYPTEEHGAELEVKLWRLLANCDEDVELADLLVVRDGA